MASNNSESEILPLIRDRVRKHLLANRTSRQLPKDQQLAIAHDSVSAFHYIVAGDGDSMPTQVQLSGDSPVIRALADKPPLPEGDTAGQRFAESGAVAAQQGSEA